MNCSKCQQLLVAYQEGLLERENEQAVAEHLRDCDVCKAELEALAGIRDRLVQEARASSSGPLVAQVMVRIVREEELRSRRITMIRKYRSALSVAAAVLLIGAVAVLMFVSPERLPTFVQLVEASEAAAAQVTSLHFTGRTGSGGKMRDAETYIKNPFFFRQDLADGSYVVMTTDKVCHYEKEENVFMATRLDKDDIWFGTEKIDVDSVLNATAFFTKQMWMAYIAQDPEAVKAEIKETVIEGKPVYKVALSIPDGEDLDLYFDKASGLLVRIVDKSDGGGVVAELVEVNPDLDDNLFSTEPPAGAKVVGIEGKEAREN